MVSAYATCRFFNILGLVSLRKYTFEGADTVGECGLPKSTGMPGVKSASVCGYLAVGIVVL